MSLLSFMELFCVLSWYHPVAAKWNERASFENLRIYGLLTDSVQFNFYSYDPLTKEFAFDDYFSGGTARDYSVDMIQGMWLFLTLVRSQLTRTCLVCNKIFSILLTAYIDILQAKASRVVEEAINGDVSDRPSHAQCLVWLALIKFTDVFKLQDSIWARGKLQLILSQQDTNHNNSLLNSSFVPVPIVGGSWGIAGKLDYIMLSSLVISFVKSLKQTTILR